MSSLRIFSSASMTFAGFPDFESDIIVPSDAGTTCQETPKRSFNQPQGPSSPPSAVRRAQISSSSFCVSHVATNENASVNLKDGPPSKAVYSCPSSRKLACRTLPSGTAPPWDRNRLRTLEFGNNET